MSKEQIEKQQNKGLKYVIFAAIVFLAIWALYLLSFYSYYNEAYFYIDKRLSIFYQLLVLVNDNLGDTVKYLAIAALLMTVTFVFIYFIFLTNKRKAYPKVVLYGLYCLNALYFLLLLLNVYGGVYFILSVLSGSIVYALVTIGNKSDHIQPQDDYEEGDILETKGPFESAETAQKEARLLVEKWQENSHLVLGEELYQEKDSSYYVDIYIEAIKK
ncbi:hypothetical protein [Enterococcus rotai]|uniref:hypothetical protein n=1 Tax=Enterococcus rotai TaxID=118060 RepID=UPI0032B5E143